jgi:hypothetical protein
MAEQPPLLVSELRGKTDPVFVSTASASCPHSIFSFSLPFHTLSRYLPVCQLPNAIMSR